MQIYSTIMNESTEKDLQIYTRFFFQRKYVAPVYESSGIMLKLADMDVHILYNLGSLYEIDNIISECMLLCGVMVEEGN